MRKNILSIFIVGGLLMLFSCVDEELGPIITFDKAAKGAYVKLLQESDSRDINLFDIPGSSYTYSVEFRDAEGGTLVTEYRLDATFKDANPNKGGDDSKGPDVFRTFSSSEFEDTPDGFKGLSNITITANDLISWAGLTADELGPGDQFVIDGTISTTNGSVHNFDNSSAAVNGSAFGGHFRFNLTASCPTELAGTYDVVVQDTWCGDVPLPNAQVTLTLTASGYDIDDFSLGAYDNCYGEGSTKPGGSLRMVDVCNGITITGASRWDEVYTWSDLTVDGNNLTITWTNDYGEGGTSTIINPNGWPDLTLD